MTLYISLFRPNRYSFNKAEAHYIEEMRQKEYNFGILKNTIQSFAYKKIPYKVFVFCLKLSFYLTATT